jgi:hypothetical protein
MEVEDPAISEPQKAGGNTTPGKSNPRYAQNPLVAIQVRTDMLVDRQNRI